MVRQQAEEVKRAKEGGSEFSMAASPHFRIWQPGRRQGRVLGVWLGTARASGKCLQCFSGVPRAAVVKCKTSLKNRSWSELEGLWMTIVMGWQKMEASEAEGKDRDAAMR